MAYDAPLLHTKTLFTFLISVVIILYMRNEMYHSIYIGKPNIVSIWAQNKAGLTAEVASGSVVIDTTAAIGGTVTCPNYAQVNTIFHRILSKGSNISELEFPMVSFSRFMVNATWTDLSVRKFVSLNADIFSRFSCLPHHPRGDCLNIK